MGATISARPMASRIETMLLICDATKDRTLNKRSLPFDVVLLQTISFRFMKNTKSQTYSRRKWLPSASTAAAVAGVGFIATKSKAAEPEKIISSASPGARVYDIRDFG